MKSLTTSLMYMKRTYRISLFLRQITYKLLFICITFLLAGSLNAQLTIEADIDTNSSCPSGSNGILDVSVSGGTPPYNYEWTRNGIPLSCDAAIDFSVLDGIACPPENGAGCPPTNSCTTTTTAINNQMFTTLQGAVLTVDTPTPNGGACVDENEINDSHLSGTVALRIGASMNGNPGPAANVTNVWQFSPSACNLNIFINDIDDEDVVIVNALDANGNLIQLTASDFIQTNSDPNVNACPVFVGGNTWQSQNCPQVASSDRGGFVITFPTCVSEVEFIYYARI